jgi:hypothetical protein
MRGSCAARDTHLLVPTGVLHSARSWTSTTVTMEADGLAGPIPVTAGVSRASRCPETGHRPS